MAWNKCRYMHRDVSVGNMLIYPHVVRTDEGTYQVYWKKLGSMNTKKNYRIFYGYDDYLIESILEGIFVSGFNRLKQTKNAPGVFHKQF